MIIAFTLLFAVLSSYFNNMATFCLQQNYVFDISNFTGAYIVKLREFFSSLTTLSETDSSKLNQIGKHKCFNGISLLAPRAYS